jgi:hypothetical protein
MPGPLSHPRPSRGCCALTRRLGPPLVLRRARVCTPREQQDIALPLMIALSPPQQRSPNRTALDRHSSFTDLTQRSA